MAISAGLLQSLVPIILSPEEYERLTEIEEEYFLLLEANKRMADNGNNKSVSFDSVMSNLGISEDELSDMADEQIYKEAAKRREKHDL